MLANAEKAADGEDVADKMTVLQDEILGLTNGLFSSVLDIEADQGRSSYGSARRPAARGRMLRREGVGVCANVGDDMAVATASARAMRSIGILRGWFCGEPAINSLRARAPTRALRMRRRRFA
jgi:hypothetical protein